MHVLIIILLVILILILAPALLGVSVVLSSAILKFLWQWVLPFIAAIVLGLILEDWKQNRKYKKAERKAQKEKLKRERRIQEEEEIERKELEQLKQ